MNRPYVRYIIHICNSTVVEHIPSPSPYFYLGLDMIYPASCVYWRLPKHLISSCSLQRSSVSTSSVVTTFFQFSSSALLRYNFHHTFNEWSIPRTQTSFLSTPAVIYPTPALGNYWYPFCHYKLVMSFSRISDR